MTKLDSLETNELFLKHGSPNTVYQVTGFNLDEEGNLLAVEACIFLKAIPSETGLFFYWTVPTVSSVEEINPQTPISRFVC